MAIVIAVMLGCIASFICGAYAAGFKDEASQNEPITQENPAELKLKEQWENFLNYDGNDRRN